MTVTDLMVGDWVYGCTNPMEGEQKKFEAQVSKIEMPDSIATLGPNFLLDDDIEEWEWYDLEPIPLTPEILEKNGWKIDGVKRGRFYWNEFVPFYIPVGEGWSEKDEKVFYDDLYGYVLMRLTTVHELQHALRLCGIEKEIVI